MRELSPNWTETLLNFGKMTKMSLIFGDYFFMTKGDVIRNISSDNTGRIKNIVYHNPPTFSKSGSSKKKIKKNPISYR